MPSDANLLDQELVVMASTVGTRPSFSLRSEIVLHPVVF